MLYTLTVIKKVVVSKVPWFQKRKKPNPTPATSSLQVPLLTAPAEVELAPLSQTPQPLPPAPSDISARSSTWTWLKEKVIGGWRALKPLSIIKASSLPAVVSNSRATQVWHALTQSRAANAAIGLFAQFRSTFFLLNVITASCYAEANDLFAFDAVAGPIINQAFLGIAIAEAVAALLLVLLYNARMQHSNHLIEAGETLVHSTLLADVIFGRSKIYIGWLAGIAFAIAQRFGPGTQRTKIYSHALPDAPAAPQIASPSHVKTAASYGVRLLQLMGGMVNSFTPSYKMVEFLAQNFSALVIKVLAFTIGSVWGALFTAVNIGTQFVRNNTNLALALTLLVAVNHSKGSLWQSMLTFCSLWASFNMAGFNFGNNALTWIFFALAFLPSGHAACVAAQSAQERIAENDATQAATSLPVAITHERSNQTTGFFRESNVQLELIADTDATSQENQAPASAPS